MECAICKDIITHNLIITDCKHHFHKYCLRPWLNINNTCPYCRKSCANLKYELQSPITLRPFKKNNLYNIMHNISSKYDIIIYISLLYIFSLILSNISENPITQILLNISANIHYIACFIWCSIIIKGHEYESNPENWRNNFIEYR